MEKVEFNVVQFVVCIGGLLYGILDLVAGVAVCLQSEIAMSFSFIWVGCLFAFINGLLALHAATSNHLTVKQVTTCFCFGIATLLIHVLDINLALVGVIVSGAPSNYASPIPAATRTVAAQAARIVVVFNMLLMESVGVYFSNKFLKSLAALQLPARNVTVYGSGYSARPPNHYYSTQLQLPTGAYSQEGARYPTLPPPPRFSHPAEHIYSTPNKQTSQLHPSLGQAASYPESYPATANTQVIGKPLESSNPRSTDDDENVYVEFHDIIPQVVASPKVQVNYKPTVTIRKTSCSSEDNPDTMNDSGQSRRSESIEFNTVENGYRE